jgi:hypothetical protein
MTRMSGHRRARVLGVVALAVFGLSACTSEDDRVRFDGVFFRAKASKVDDDRSKFAATVFNAVQAIDSAREAGRYEGTKYCIANYGTSRIDWALGPDDPEDQLQIRDGALLLEGQCSP